MRSFVVNFASLGIRHCTAVPSARELSVFLVIYFYAMPEDEASLISSLCVLLPPTPVAVEKACPFEPTPAQTGLIY